MRIIYCLMILLCPILSKAQTTPVLKPLSIGDRVPDLVFNKVINASFKSTSIAAYADKLLLVDFWATWCGSCIREFPKLDSLQRKYNGRMQVLLVNNPKSGDDENKINAFLDRKKGADGKRIGLPIVLNDTQLSIFFPHLAIPHTVWIYGSKVVAITGSLDVTDSNLQTILNNKQIDLDLKADQMNFDAGKPLIEQGNGGSATAIMYRSMFTHFLNGASGSIGQQLMENKTVRRRYIINKPLLTLYHYAIPGVNANRILADEALYPFIFCDTLNSRWRSQFNFCYEQWTPADMPVEQQQLRMQADLDQQFGIQSSVEKQFIECYILKLKDERLLASGKKNNAADGLRRQDPGSWILNNKPLSDLLLNLNFQSMGKPLAPVVLDETGYTLPVTIELKLKDLHDLPALQNVVLQYGLEMVKEKRQIEMLVLRKKIVSPTN